MSDDSVALIKNILVAAAEGVQEGDRTLAHNLFELAMDEMEKVSPEDLEVRLLVLDDNQEVGCDVEHLDESDLEPEGSEETASGLHRVLDGLIARG